MYVRILKGGIFLQMIGLWVKHFHVSPFFDRTGRYVFQFSYEAQTIDIHIDYEDDSGEKRLLTRLYGRLAPMNRRNLARAFFLYPFITGKGIFLIHWQALKLFLKKATFYTKPVQQKENVTCAYVSIKKKRDK